MSNHYPAAIYLSYQLTGRVTANIMKDALAETSPDQYACLSNLTVCDAPRFEGDVRTAYKENGDLGLVVLDYIYREKATMKALDTLARVSKELSKPLPAIAIFSYEKPDRIREFISLAKKETPFKTIENWTPLMYSEQPFAPLSIIAGFQRAHATQPAAPR
jgi:hypothetical protein